MILEKSNLPRKTSAGSNHLDLQVEEKYPDQSTEGIDPFRAAGCYVINPNQPCMLRAEHSEGRSRIEDAHSDRGPIAVKKPHFGGWLESAHPGNGSIRYGNRVVDDRHARLL